MSRPGSGRRIDIRREVTFGGALPQAPFASDLIHAWYADREIVLATGVAAWGDAVGTTDFAQADTSKQPAYGVFTTSPALVFDDVNDTMSAPSMDLSAQAEITFAANLSFVGSGQGMVFTSSPNTGAMPGAFFIYETAGTVQVLRRNAAANIIRQPVITAGAKTLIAVFSTTDASAIPVLEIDGVSGGVVPVASNVPFISSVPWIGTEGGVSAPWGGKLGDVLIYGRALTAGERATVNAWLTARRV